MVTVSIFSLVVLAFVYAQLFGLKQDQLIQSKLGASDQSRVAFDQFARDVRSAKSYEVGNLSGTTFAGIANGTPQQGSALRLFLSTNLSVYIVYYFDTNNGELHRMHTGVTGSTLIAQHLTNTMYFRAERYNGAIQTDLSHKGVIHTTLWFWQYQYPTTIVGLGAYYDSYKMDFKFSPHAPDGN